MANQYSITNLLKKIWEFISWFFGFLRGRKQQQNIQINNALKNKYDNIDQDKENKKDDKIEDRLNNMFRS